MEDFLFKIRKLCLSYPEVAERISHGHPAFFVREKKLLAMYRPSEQPAALWCPAPSGALGHWQNVSRDMFYYPPYMGPLGWVGIYLTEDTDWELVDIVVRDAYGKVAPKRLIQAAEEQGKYFGNS